MAKAPVEVWVLGAGGMLGRAWCQMLKADGRAFAGSTREDCDITDSDAIAKGLKKHKPVVVVNCAAYTNVDGAEEDEATASKINGEAVDTLAKRCAEAGATLVNYSTDYVFDGFASSPYTAGQTRSPLNAYGRSKALGEMALEASDARWLNVRTSWLYAPWGKNFVLTMAKLTGEKEQLKVVADQRGRPTSCEPLARNSLRLLQAGVTGHVHLCDSGETTWHGLTQAINSHLHHTCDIHACSTEDFPRPAKRPAYSVLDLSIAEEHLGRLDDWRESLVNVLDRVSQEKI